MSAAPAPSVQQLFDLSGRSALVSGASGLLGSALAAALAEAGCRVVVASRDAEKGRTAAAALGGAEQGRHLSVVMDHLDEASIDRAFAEAVQATGGLDILINNGHDPVRTDWRTITGAQFNRQLANATGYFLLSRHLRDHAVERGAAASIVLIGSMYGIVGSYPDAYAELVPASPAAYQTLKGGLIQLTRHLAVYWAADRVRVNCLSPGPFPGPTIHAELVQRLCRKSPMGRMGLPHELKGPLLLLVSDAGSYITGQNIVVDGGWTAW